jgi:hypothetical protein
MAEAYCTIDWPGYRLARAVMTQMLTIPVSEAGKMDNQAFCLAKDTMIPGTDKMSVETMNIKNSRLI